MNDTTPLPVVPACVPGELRSLHQWVVWALEGRESRRTKIPYDPHTARHAKSNDPATWRDFDRALSRYAADTQRWAGVGFMFAGDNGYVGIDLDKCRDHAGNIASWARDIITRLNTYAEISPSGTGVKLWARGRLPGDGSGRKRPYQSGAVEMYSRGRFFAVTGHRLEPGADGINGAQAAIDWLWREALEDRRSSESPKWQTSETDEARIIERARKYVAAMPAAVSGQGGHDATFEVACKLVLGFRLAPRAAMQIMREYSARCNPPWTERELWHKLNSADKQPGERGYLLEKPAGGGEREKVVKPGATRQDRKAVAGGMVAAKDLDPRPQVEALVKSITRDGVPAIRFWRGTFWRWSGGRYREMLPAETRVRMVQHLNRVAARLTREVVNNHLMQFEAQTSLDAEMEPPAWLADSAWPAREILACRNSLVHLPGYLDGRADCQRAATPKYFNTSAIDFDFDRAAAMPVAWQRFLADIWGDDLDSVDALREWFGYCLTPDTSQHKILLLVGPPRSGKGTIARIQRELVGRANVAGPTLTGLGTNFGLWPLIGKSLAIISDARLGGRADVAEIIERLLSISGEDALTIDRKTLVPLTCTLPTRLVILTNELPRFTDASGALASRMLILRMAKSWLGSEDHSLTGRLLKELPGILLWSITGWRRLRERGHFVEPSASADVREQLAELSSAVGLFLRERCEIGPQFSIPRAELYAAYREWCEAAGKDRIEDQAGFGRGLRAAVPGLGSSQPRIEGAPTRIYTGLCLRPESF